MYIPNYHLQFLNIGNKNNMAEKANLTQGYIIQSLLTFIHSKI